MEQKALLKFLSVNEIQYDKIYSKNYNKISVIKDSSKFQDKYVLNLVKCIIYKTKNMLYT